MGSLFLTHIDGGNQDIEVKLSPQPSWTRGICVPVKIEGEDSSTKKINSVEVQALLDTSSWRTMIHESVVKHLGLSPTSTYPPEPNTHSPTYYDYLVTVSFVGSNLSSRRGSALGNGQWPFNLEDHIKNPSGENGCGLILGREIMRYWNTIWNGPTGTLIINDA